MKDYVTVIAAVITGISAIITAVSAWKLNSLSTEKTRDFTLKKEKYDELKELYTETYAAFESVMNQIRTQNFNESGLELIKINGKIRLLAPENIIKQYFLTCSILENWSYLHKQASPAKTKIGDTVYATIQVPDPTQKFREPAQQEYENLQKEANKLFDLMRIDIEKRI